MIRDPYEDFAERYDLFFENFDEHDADYVAFLRSLVAEHQIRTVLDCACGTGRDLHLLHSLGCRVEGSDISEAMLAQAHKNLSSCRIEVPLKQVDFRQLPQHLEGPFDAVVCLSTSLPHLLKEAEVVRALASMREVLRRRYRRAVEEEDDGPGKRVDPVWRMLPDLLIVDGGKGQLGVAVDVLKELDLFEVVSVVGLAKQEELLFQPGQSQPARLDRKSPEMYLVQRIRDEAHRFAVTYQRLLRLHDDNITVYRGEGIARLTRSNIVQKRQPL